MTEARQTTGTKQRKSRPAIIAQIILKYSFISKLVLIYKDILYGCTKTQFEGFACGTSEHSMQ